uniref:Kinase n=1 Tax=Lepisosteus oculatus TaxID=7918 RepID=W5N4I6_LEPOC|nr:PREDICTED: inositol hexakisphosphate kinase 3 isoform X1 [Lepisosteus oculatus]
MPSGQRPQQNWTRTSVSCNSGARQEQWSAVILSSLPILCSLSSSTAVQLLDAQPSPLYREPRKFGGTPSPSPSVLKPGVHPWVVDSRRIPATQCLAGPHASMVLLNGVEDGDLRTRVRLEPFIHQVGGHAGMMRYNETTICKPLFSNELGFYQSLPAEMQAFTPRFKGLISVSLERDSSGQLVLVASPHKDNQSPAPPSPKAHRNKKTKASSPDHQEIREIPLQDRSHHDRTLGCTGRGLGSDVPFHMEDPNGNESKLSEQNSHNPWGLRCHRAQLSRMSSQGASNVLHWFVLLENVVWPFMRPCVLDLKMGTRQHGDDAPEEKKRRHMKKCEQSTSSSLGLRLGGMQVFQVTSDHFLCRNKYYGRTLSGAGLRQALCQFLHNGRWVRRELIGPILQRLGQLRAVLQRQGSYRFYSSSLLLIYEGVESPSASPSVDVRMIDFAHTTFRGAHHPHTPAYDGPDQGYIFGLDNLIGILKEIRDGE